ncbi:hypothetical protein Vqi01_30510 [Micromonospora qiuiae]|uniref:VOC domain-containing protein n=1 Tax=Micromonospora qiuiae TaxID=502268 RepID=A0ABQ4JCK9_9ACTN|nr:VOC family protein [Micromonospora qiuiae]GIJ27889.1 hypothetical protein Vqi01_30510 [Micromonospora qiuiae]
MPGIPTARNVDHIAYTVPDLDQADKFFTDVLGAQVLYRLGPVQEPDTDWMAVQLDVHPRASAQISLLRLGEVTNLELFEYTAPDQQTVPPESTDVGGYHIIFDVASLDDAAAHLARHGVATSRRGDSLFFTSPWGMAFEARLAPQVDGLFRPGGSWNVSQVRYTVADLATCVGYFTEHLGARLLQRDPDRALLRLGPVTNLELRQCPPGARTRRPRNSDIGGHHLAFHAEDVDAAAAYLRGLPGFRVLGDVQLIEDGGPIHGDRWFYFTAPDGFQLEVLNMPPGMPYEQFTSARRFGPAAEWTND